METQEKPQEKPRTIVDDAREERVALEKLRDEIKQERILLQELKAQEALGGKTEISDTKPKEIDPREYAKAILQNK